MNAKQIADKASESINFPVSPYGISIADLIEKQAIRNYKSMNDHYNIVMKDNIKRETERNEMLAKMTDRERRIFLFKEKFNKRYQEIRYSIKSLFNLRIKIVDKNKWQEFTDEY